MSPHGDYKLGDFGIAKTIEKTIGGTKIGTYKYMAPEVYNNQPYGSAADIYSLGLVLYWMLNERRLPFFPLPPQTPTAAIDEEARRKRFTGERIPSPAHGSNELKKIILKACAFDPKDRYASATEMKSALMAIRKPSETTTAISDIMNKAVQPIELESTTTGDEDETVGVWSTYQREQNTTAHVAGELSSAIDVTGPSDNAKTNEKQEVTVNMIGIPTSNEKTINIGNTEGFFSQRSDANETQLYKNNVKNKKGMAVIIVVCLALVLIFCLAMPQFRKNGTGDDVSLQASTTTKNTTTPATIPTTAMTTAPEVSKTEYAGTEMETTQVIEEISKVAIVTDVGTIDDEGFNEACWNGVENWCQANYVDYTYYMPEEDSDDACVIAVVQAVMEGADVLGYLFGTALIEVQDLYPDVYFVAVDVGQGDLTYTYDYVDYYSPGANAVCLTFAEEQAGYLAGYAAVCEGYTQLGFLGGMAVPTVIRYGHGFIQGADAADKDMEVNIEIKYAYSGVFDSTPKLTAEMEKWYASGTEVVFACGGGVYNSVIEAAEKYGRKMIGVDVDQGNVSPNVLTSAVKNMAKSVEYALDSLKNGAWEQNFGGKVVTLSLRDGDYLILPTKYDSWRFTEFSTAQYEMIRNEIASGNCVVSYNTESMPTMSNTIVEEVWISAF